MKETWDEEDGRLDDRGDDRGWVWRATTRRRPRDHPPPAAAQRVGVTAVDFAFEGVPETLEADETTFVLTNEGEVRHEMTIGRLPAGWTIEEVALEPSDSGTEVLGNIAPIEPGASGEVTLKLEAGRYG